MDQLVTQVFAVLYGIPSDLASSVQFIPLRVPSIARILSSLVCFYTLLGVCRSLTKYYVDKTFSCGWSTFSFAV